MIGIFWKYYLNILIILVAAKVSLFLAPEIFIWYQATSCNAHLEWQDSGHVNRIISDVLGIIQLTNPGPIRVKTWSTQWPHGQQRKAYPYCWKGPRSRARGWSRLVNAMFRKMPSRHNIDIEISKLWWIWLWCCSWCQSRVVWSWLVASHTLHGQQQRNVKFCIVCGNLLHASMPAPRKY